MERKHIGKCMVLSLALTAFQADADTIRFYLDESNALPDGVQYAQVTISDSEDTAGDINFTVELLAEAFDTTGSNFGMQDFSFNVDDALTLDASNIVDMSEPGWNVAESRNAGGGFGKFDVQLSGTGNSRTELLTFSISGVAGDTIYSYATGSALHPDADEFFSTHIAGFDETKYVTSAKFAGSTSFVPVPAAALLLASGLVVLGAGIRRG